MNDISIKILGIGDWGLGIGDWGLGIGDWAQSPITNPQSPITVLNHNSSNIVKSIIYINILSKLINIIKKLGTKDSSIIDTEYGGWGIGNWGVGIGDW